MDGLLFCPPTRSVLNFSMIFKSLGPFTLNSISGSGHEKYQKSSQPCTMSEHSAWNNFSFCLLFRVLYYCMAAGHVFMIPPALILHKMSSGLLALTIYHLVHLTSSQVNVNKKMISKIDISCPDQILKKLALTKMTMQCQYIAGCSLIGSF